MINYRSNGKVTIIHLIVGLIKKIYNKIRYYPEPYSRSTSQIKVELDVSNYGTKSNLKNAAGVGASEFPKKGNLADLKSDIDKTDIRKLQTTLVGLITLSNLVKNEVIKKTLYDKFF